MRDIFLGDTRDFKFTTRQFSDGVPTTAVGLTVAAYPDNSITQITAGITVTFTSGFDGVAGLVNVRVVATGGNGYLDDTDYALVVTAGTVGGVSIVGEVVGEFSIQRAPVNWANVSNPTTAVDLSATDIQLVDTVTTLTGHTAQTGDNYARLGAPAGASISADLADVPTVSEFNARTLAAASYFDPAADTVANVTTVATTTDLTNLPTIPANWLTAAGIAASALDGKGDWELAGVAPTVAEITADVWDEATATARTAGTYGQLFKDNVDATISSRMATTHLDATAGKLDGVALADTITTYTGNTLQTGDVTTAINDLANGTDGLGALKTLIDTVNTDLGNGTDGLGALKTLIDALQTDLDTLTDTSAEPTGVPAASATLLTKVGYLYMALRNQVDVTATKKTFYGDDGVAEWEKDLSDDTTTYSESEGNAI